jgi:hypothetical protein
MNPDSRTTGSPSHGEDPLIHRSQSEANSLPHCLSRLEPSPTISTAELLRWPRVSKNSFEQSSTAAPPVGPPRALKLACHRGDRGRPQDVFHLQHPAAAAARVGSMNQCGCVGSTRGNHQCYKLGNLCCYFFFSFFTL